MYRLGMLLSAAALCVSAADWNVRAAAGYLDRRQTEWSAWPYAQKSAGPCLSCHTGVFYLLARPGLRNALDEMAPPKPEIELLAVVRMRAGVLDPAGAGAVPGREQ